MTMLLDEVPLTTRANGSRPSKPASGKSGAISIASDPREDLLVAIQELTPAITARLAEIEAGRRIPPDLPAIRCRPASSSASATSDILTEPLSVNAGSGRLAEHLRTAFGRAASEAP
jgi:hypothetical protein